MKKTKTKSAKVRFAVTMIVEFRPQDGARMTRAALEEELRTCDTWVRTEQGDVCGSFTNVTVADVGVEAKKPPKTAPKTKTTKKKGS